MRIICNLGRRALLTAAMAAASPAWGQPAAPLPGPVILDITNDRARRMRVPVAVDGRGPYPFLVDTGADRTVLSQELALALGLPAAGAARVNGIAGAVVAERARVRSLEVGGKRLADAALPVLPMAHLGAAGLIGLDCLTDQRVAIDFARQTLRVEPSRKVLFEADAVVVRGRRRFGQLILVDSTLRNTPLFVVLDTGAQNTMGNPALRALLERRRRARRDPDPLSAVELQSATGQSVTGELDALPELSLGGVTLGRLPVIYAELHTFRLFGLIDEPALMLGMDVMRSFARVSIDFGRREVGFEMR